MNIAQVRQGQQPGAVKEQSTLTATPNLDLLQAFQGQLHFAEADLNLHKTGKINIEDPRNRYEEVEQKRKEDDSEKAVAAAFWSNQQTDMRLEQAAVDKSKNLDLQTTLTKENEQIQQRTIENASSKKDLNFEMGKDRILRQKPHVISSGNQNEDPLLNKEQFAELLKNQQKSAASNNYTNINKSGVSEFPVSAEQQSQVASQFMMRPTKSQNQSQTAEKRNVDGKVNALQMDAKPASASNRESSKIDPKFAFKQTKGETAKSERFTNQLDLAAKDNLKSETLEAKKLDQSSDLRSKNLQEVINNIKVLLSSSKDTLVMRLAPEHLGKLEIKLKKSGDHLIGEFKVDNIEAKDLLMADFAKLQEDLKNQGIKLEQYSVYVKGEKDSTLNQHKIAKSNPVNRKGSKSQISQEIADAGTDGSPSSEDANLNLII